MHANIYVYRIRLIAEFLGDGMKCSGKLQSHCANMTFSWKIRYDRAFQKVTHKGEESAMNYINIFQHAQALSVSVEKLTQNIN